MWFWNILNSWTNVSGLSCQMSWTSIINANHLQSCRTWPRLLVAKRLFDCKIRHCLLYDFSVFKNTSQSIVYVQWYKPCWHILLGVTTGVRSPEWEMLSLSGTRWLVYVHSANRRLNFHGCWTVNCVRMTFSSTFPIPYSSTTTSFHLL